MPNLFRIHIRPKGGNDDMVATFNHCLENGFLGVGWRVDGLHNTDDWATYEQAANRVHDSIQQPRYIYRYVKPRDLVWTRDPDARYYLARVNSGWEYWTSPEGRENDIDIANVFHCDFCEVDPDAVPGVVVASFGRPGHSIQRIWDKSAVVYSEHRWNACANDQVYDVDLADFPDIFQMLDPIEIEDVVFLYLQSRGWYVIPNSRRGNTMRFEYMLANPGNGEIALTQVKAGDSWLNVDDYADEAQHIFLFQANELYDGRPTDNVTCITRDEFVNFLQENVEWMPQSIQTKLRMVANP